MKVLLSYILIISTITAFAQGVYNNSGRLVINSGGCITIDGNANGNFRNEGTGSVISDGNIYLEGTWTNNASTNVFTSTNATGIVSFTGTVDQQIAGSNKTIFENLTVNNANNVVLAQNTDILYNLTLTSGNFDLKDKIANLGADGTIVNETELNRVTSTDGSGAVGHNTGTIIATRTLNAPSGVNPANLGVVITTTANLGAITITRGHEIQTGSYGGVPSVGVARYYEIPGIGELDVAGGKTINMYYWNAELNGLTEANIEGFQWVTEGSGSWWTPLDGSVNTSSNLFTTSGVPYAPYQSWSLVTFNNRFTLGSKVTPLPIVLAEAKILCSEKGANISWKTLSEINNNYFTIDESIDGINYKEIAEIEGAGSSNSITNYLYIDELNNQTKYYRLSQTDFDGTKETFKIMMANCVNTNNNQNIILYPNPAKEQVNIKIDNYSFTELTITDILGKQVFNTNINSIDGIIQINTNSLSSGVYNVNLKSEQTQITKQLIITK